MIRTIHYSDILDAPNAKELIAAYDAECSIPAIGSINPQRDMYEHMEGSGSMVCFGAYSGDELVGFVSILISTLPHYGKQVATIESLYVHKERRRSGPFGLELMGTAKRFAKLVGQTGVFYSAKPGSQLERILMRRKSCIRTHTIFLEVL